MLRKKVIASVVAVYAMTSVFAAPIAKSEAQTFEVHLIREYLDGERSTEVKEEKANTLADLLLAYKDWQFIKSADASVVLYKKIHDISPLLKTNGYFGISGDDILTIFDGKPSDDKAIHSFYQLDVEKLESHLIDKLKSGIPIHSKKDYVMVIKKFKRYEKQAC